jgi:hypothetical protein
MIQVLNPFLLFMVSFQKTKIHVLAILLNPCYKGLKLVIQYVNKEKTLQIANEYDEQTLFSLIVFACNFVNPYDTCARVPSSTS